MATTDFYHQAIAQLRQRAAAGEHIDPEESAAIRIAAEKLNAWLEAGQPGECPVDLRQFGLTPPAPAEAAAPETPRPPEQEAALPVPAPPSEPERPAPTALPGADGQLPPHGPPDSAKVETPEQDSLRRLLTQAREHYQAKRWPQAVAMSQSIVDRAGFDPELKQTAEDLLDRARRELNARLERALADGAEARETGDIEQARHHYRAALDLDPANEDAKRAGLELDQLLQDRLSQEQRTRLRRGLLERRDLRRLGEAVYWAEALYAEGHLPYEPVVLEKDAEGRPTRTTTFEALMREARAAYDAIRQAHGEGTTLMHFGDLAARKKARDDIAARVTAGDRYILDVVLGRDRLATEVLQEADRLLAEMSESTANYIIGLIKRALPAHPVWAQQRLQAALQQPFHEAHRRILEDLETEIEGHVKRQSKAEALLAEAEASGDSVTVFHKVLQAHAAFSHLPGLPERVEQARQTALMTLAAQIRKHHREAEARLQAEDFKGSREEVALADNLAALWPEEGEGSPEILRELVRIGEELDGKIKSSEAIRLRLNRLVQSIRAQVSKPDLRQAGLALFRQTTQDPDFANLPELRALRSEMDQYTDVGEWLAGARLAQAKSDWERVRELCEKVILSGKAGRLASEAGELLQKALLELSIARARRHLENDEIRQANAALSTLMTDQPDDSDEDRSRKAAVRKRLQPELNKIDQAIADTPSIQPLYDRALAVLGLRQQSSHLWALLDPWEVLKETAPAWRTLVQESGVGSVADDLKPYRLAEYAAGLLQTELASHGVTERLKAVLLLRYVSGEWESAVSPSQEVRQGSAPTTDEERLLRYVGGEWDADKKRPREWPDYRLTLRTADARRVARVVADGLARDVLAALQSAYAARPRLPDDDNLRTLAEQARGLREADLLKSEAERRVGRWAEIEWGKREATAREAREDWAGAVTIWTELNMRHPRTPEVEAGLQNAQTRKQAVGEALAQAAQKLEKEWLRAALAGLQAALKQGLTRDSLALSRERDRIYHEAEACLLNLAHTGRTAGGDEGRIRAAVALVDLRELEEVMGVPEADRKSTPELAGLRNDLENMARTVVRSAADFLTRMTAPPTQGSIVTSVAGAMAEARTLSGRLQSLVDLARSFSELDPVKDPLDRRHNEITLAQRNLEAAETHLEAVRSPALWAEVNGSETTSGQDLWIAAFQTSNFSGLKQEADQIHADLNNLSDVKQFRKRLEECEELDSWLARKIVEIKEAFYADQFETVAAQVRGLAARPDYQPTADPQESPSEPWRHIQQAQYAQVHGIVSDRLIIADVFGDANLAGKGAMAEAARERDEQKNLVGWNVVEKEARERDAELKEWERWNGECEVLMTQAFEAVRVTESYGSNTPPLTTKQGDWERVRNTAGTVLKALTGVEYHLDPAATQPASGANEKSLIVGPRRGGQPVPMRSRRAKTLRAEGERRLGAAHKWLVAAEAKLEKIELELKKRGFPTAEQFRDAQNDSSKLLEVVRRAISIGPSNDEERARLQTYLSLLPLEEQKRLQNSSLPAEEKTSQEPPPQETRPANPLRAFLDRFINR